MLRPVEEIDPHTLAVLVSLLCPPTGRADATPNETTGELVRGVRADPNAGKRFVTTLDRLLRADAVHEPVAGRSEELRAAALASDALRMARVLWSASRRHGAAWRRLEERARHALVLTAVRALDLSRSPYADALAAK